MSTPLLSIRVTKKGAPKPKLATHVIRGRIHGIHTSHDGKYVHLEIKHGRKPKAKKGKKENYPGALAFDDRPMSHIALPADVAKNYGVGAHVHIGLAPAQNPASNLDPGDPDADDDVDETEDDEGDL